MRAHFNADGTGDGAHFSLMVGDQIYADMLNRHVPILRADTYQEFQDRYREAFDAPNLRRLLRSSTTYMILDDHEIEDNWTQDRMREPGKQHLFNVAISAYMSYQWSHGPRTWGRHLHYRFDCGGYPFFVLDTRTQRFKEAAPGLRDNHMLGRPRIDPAHPGQLRRLLDWLTEMQHERGNVPKFVVTSCAFVPSSIKERIDPALDPEACNGRKDDPDTEFEAVGEMQADTAAGHIGSRSGLYDLRLNDDINVFVGCGLGGTSLVNANVALDADPRAFEDARWPQALRDDVQDGLAAGFRRAREMLNPVPYPEDFPSLHKLEGLRKSAGLVGGKFSRPPINVTFTDGVNHVGVEQHACTLCGDCVSGCNYAAKNTTLMNYLPDAHNHGAEIYTQAQVRRVERRDGHWVVHYQILDTGREGFDAPALFVTADIVVLAAGTLGSTEILLRSREHGLSLSDRLGQRFTGNGDVLAFGYNNDEPINGTGYGSRPVEQMRASTGPVGPCITGVIDLRDTPELTDGVVVEEGSIPGAVGAILPPIFAASAAVIGKDTDSGVSDFLKERGREIVSLVRGPYHGAVENTQTYLVMAHDDGAGQMVLADDCLRVRWPAVGSEPVFERVNHLIEKATKAAGGTFVRNPIWTPLLHHRLITVHPLGGCVMGEDAGHGVVNHKGEVFSGREGTAVHEGLYVCDGSIVPRPLGVNPLLTISALSERALALLAGDRGWTIPYDLPSAPQAVAETAKLGIRFTESMRGYFSTQVTDDYRAAAEQGRRHGSKLEFTLTIVSDDLDALLTQPAHSARMAGTCTAAALSAQPLAVAAAEFNLLSDDPQHVATRTMRYRMQLHSEEGRRYFFEGHKVVHDDAGLDVWRDTTTLYVTVYDGSDERAPVFGKGILDIRPADFARQLATLQVTGATSLRERLQAKARFGRFFAGVLYDTYGGIFARAKPEFYADAPPRKRRPLRTGAPQVHHFKTDDGVTLRLTRYRGGSNGPVMLSHGLGVSSLIFSIDTIDTNLLEYLYAHGYDCWLLDYRASVELPSARTQFNADDVAIYDYPAAVKAVLQASAARSIQVVAHCFGSTTFTMAMLAGLQGVRSAVCSQISTHVRTPAITQVKAGLHLAGVLERIGTDSLTARAREDESVWTRFFDEALRLYPGAVDDSNPVSRRITFLYGPLYELDQLNEATYAALHEMFGVANIESFEHLALMVRNGYVLRTDGSDAYLPHLERMNIPITFIHGAENRCFLPESTALTLQALQHRNGPANYRRFVIPGYGHIDCIFGRNAVNDVFPHILDHLEKTAL